MVVVGLISDLPLLPLQVGVNPYFFENHLSPLQHFADVSIFVNEPLASDTSNGKTDC